MLWMKAWLETRWRLTFMLGVALLSILMGEQGGGLGSPEHARNFILLVSVLSIVSAIYLAGAGVRTQSPFRAKAGLHGSTLYTLSMPVSRVRLLAVRVAFGLLETVGLVIFMIVCAWSLFPLVKGTSTFLDLLKLLGTAIACITCFHFVSVAVATFLDEMWQVYGSFFVIGLAWWLSMRFSVPPSANVFCFMTGASPLVTHSLPWPAIGISLVTSALLFISALRIVERQEY